MRRATRISCLVDSEAASDCAVASLSERSRWHTLSSPFTSDTLIPGTCAVYIAE